MFLSSGRLILLVCLHQSRQSWYNSHRCYGFVVQEGFWKSGSLRLESEFTFRKISNDMVNTEVSIGIQQFANNWQEF